jgi:outer membrane protein assembly factor BamD
VPGPTLTRRLASLLLPLLLAGCGAGLLPSIHSEAERLAVARRLHDKGDYAAAAELLKVYVTNNAGANDVDQAIFLLGDCYMKAKDWVAASNEFDRMLRDYPESDSSAAARFAMAEAEFAQSKTADFDQEHTLKALDLWQQYLRDFPAHWQNAQAEQRILAARTRLADKLVRTGVLYLQLKLPDPARAYFKKVTLEYPDTIWAPEAQMGLAMCDVHQGKRAEAIAQFKEIETRYAGRPIAERAARERKRLERHS